MIGLHEDGRDWQHTHDTEVYGHLATMKLLQIAGYDSSLNHAARRVLCILAGYAGKDGYCFPSYGTMADGMGVTRQAVIRQIGMLKKAKYISVEPQWNVRGGRKSNLYRLNYSLAEKYRKEPWLYRGLETSNI